MYELGVEPIFAETFGARPPSFHFVLNSDLVILAASAPTGAAPCASWAWATPSGTLALAPCYDVASLRPWARTGRLSAVTTSVMIAKAASPA